MGVTYRDAPQYCLVIVEDDPITRSMIATYFKREGFSIHEAACGAECRDLLRGLQPDLVFIDLNLPDGNGLDLAQEIRADSPVGIIFVTQRNSAADRIRALEVAGDDYVAKPVDLRELLARTRALLRRRELDRAPKARNPVYAFGPWLIDLVRRELTAGGSPIQMTRAEFDLLAALVEAGGRPLTRDYLVEVVSNRSLGGDLRTVDTLVARIRRKLQAVSEKQEVIVTVTGVGYRLGPSVAESI